jgi:hypothetical protein
LSIKGVSICSVVSMFTKNSHVELVSFLDKLPCLVILDYVLTLSGPVLDVLESLFVGCTCSDPTLVVFGFLSFVRY